jgi:cullin-associated NEDD8-dissociated protein 1
VNEFIANVGKVEISVTCLSLLSLGYIGRQFDLSAHHDLETTIIGVLSDSSEEVKNAGSFCLGNISVGCMGKYLTVVLEAIQSNATLQYLLLHSLKEIIKRVSEDESKAAVMQSYTETMLPLLYEHAASPEEGVRNVVAECLGKIALCEPARLAELEKMISSPDARVRQTIVTAVRHAVSEKTSAVDSGLSSHAGTFLQLIDDEDLGVKRAALLTLNTLVHSKQTIVRPMLSGLLDRVYRETVVRPELIHKVCLGPFTHTVDDGLDARKAAFECLDTLVVNCVDQLEPSACLEVIVQGETCASNPRDYHHCLTVTWH